MKNININSKIFDTEGTWVTLKNEILMNGQKVGTAYTMTDSDDDDRTYLENIDIEEEFRNLGYGTLAIQKLAEINGYIYFAPTDENNKRLYQRIAEEMETDVPEVDQGFGVYFLER